MKKLSEALYSSETPALDVSGIVESVAKEKLDDVVSNEFSRVLSQNGFVVEAKDKDLDDDDKKKGDEGDDKKKGDEGDDKKKGDEGDDKKKGDEGVE